MREELNHVIKDARKKVCAIISLMKTKQQNLVGMRE